MRLLLTPAHSPSPREQWVVSAWAVSSDGEHRHPVLLHQGPSQALASRRYFEALLASDSITLKNAMEAALERRLAKGEELSEQPFGWLVGWPVDFFDQGSRTELRDPKIVYFDPLGVKFNASPALSDAEASLREALLRGPRFWLTAGEGALVSLQERVALLFEAGSEPSAQAGHDANSRRL